MTLIHKIRWSLPGRLAVLSLAWLRHPLIGIRLLRAVHGNYLGDLTPTQARERLVKEYGYAEKPATGWGLLDGMAWAEDRMTPCVYLAFYNPQLAVDDSDAYGGSALSDPVHVALLMRSLCTDDEIEEHKRSIPMELAG